MLAAIFLGAGVVVLLRSGEVEPSARAATARSLTLGAIEPAPRAEPAPAATPLPAAKPTAPKRRASAAGAPPL